jgi:hypothetical protein
MTRFILTLILVTCVDLKAQSICIDTSTLSNANHYLVEGAKARRKLIEYKKLVLLDSIEISKLDSIQTIQDEAIQCTRKEIDALRERENVLKSRVKTWRMVSLSLLLVIFGLYI